jgi:hypothetical protein
MFYIVSASHEFELLIELRIQQRSFQSLDPPAAEQDRYANKIHESVSCFGETKSCSRRHQTKRCLNL